MSIEIDFSVKYAHLINDDIPIVTIRTLDDGGDIPMLSGNIPGKYKKSFIHTEDSFVTKYCQNYGNNNTLKRVKSRNISTSGKIIKGGK